MKKITFLLVLLLCEVAYGIDTPFGFTLSDDELENLHAMEVQTFDHQLLLAEDLEKENNGLRADYGRIAFTPNVDASNAGGWRTLPNGDKIWMLRFRSMNAKAVIAYFDNLQLPTGSSMFIYPFDRSYFEGPYTHADCKVHGKFRSNEIYGDDAILEYYQPASTDGAPSLGLYGIGHLYRFVYDYRDSADEDRGGSEFCEVDVNCPEGLYWCAERDAVIRLSITDDGNIGLCSGTMMNTTAQDFRNYILTAFHCCVGVSDADLLLCSVRFNYQRTGCGTGSATTSRNKSGVVKLADSNDGGGNSGSDFALFEMEDDIPSSWPVLYAGWDASGVVPDEVIGIHHPSGDAKKISKSVEIGTTSWGVSNTHWSVEWMATETNWGVTEGGSSGSPIFDTNHRVIGQLTGGNSCCTVGGCVGFNTGPTAEDAYGKMSKNWSSNPNPATDKLKVWLDPINLGTTGTLTLDGIYPNALPCAVNITDLSIFDDLKIYPSLASNTITVFYNPIQPINEVLIFTSAGSLVEAISLKRNQTAIDISSYNNGLYYMTFKHVSGISITKKFSKID